MPRDAYAWRLLATARFLQDDRAGALAALNQAGEPAVDTVQITGLERTRAEVIEDAIDVDRGELLTPGALDRARRRLNDVPAIRSGALEFVPVTGGRAEVRATVNERRLFPTSMTDLAELAVRSIFQQDPRVSIGSMTGSGERLDVQYRFRPGRPRLGMTLSAPAPWGGVWSVQGLWERQPFDSPLVETSERTTGRVAWTDWMSGRFQVSVRGGVDRWLDIGTRATVGAMAYATSLDDRISVRLDVDTWMGDTEFSSAKTIAKYRSSNRREGLVFVASAGAGVASDGLPIESWFAGDSGNARPGPVPLRAHGLVQDSRYFRTDQMGRTIVHGSGEGQVLVPPPGALAAKPADPKPADVKPTGVGGLAGPGGIAALRENLRIGVAVFLDSARVTRRLSPGDRDDVDIGARPSHRPGRPRVRSRGLRPRPDQRGQQVLVRFRALEIANQRCRRADTGGPAAGTTSAPRRSCGLQPSFSVSWRRRPATSRPPGPRSPSISASRWRQAKRPRSKAAASRLRFEGVTGDSRCPVDAICIQGGDAIVKVQASGDGGSVVARTPHRRLVARVGDLRQP